MEELKPCPFCGNKEGLGMGISGVDSNFVYCQCNTKKVAHGWNARPLEDALESRVDFLEDKIQEIVDWADAYPLAIFPEPDFKKARVALESAGISLDQVSASNMRHVVTGVGNIAREALKGGE